MSGNHCDWPDATAETRPWTRWWWPGSAVDKPTLTRLMETYRRVGFGGVEITSIYGVKGQEQRAIDYLSREWLDMIRHVIAEAERLGMKVDLPPGSGWRIGGDFISDDVAAATLSVEETDGGWRAESVPSGALVKRAGPGGTGKSFNPFSSAAMETVTAHFTPSFDGLGIRAQFHDSWEYSSNSCPGIFDEFLRRRGYDLRDRLAELAGKGDGDTAARVKYDYQLTLAELALEDFIIPWTEWCRGLGQLSRNQAHGSPGNILDLYAAADIPETEVFRCITPDSPFYSKFASSAGHVVGRTLVSSETCTWLQEHFHVSLADAKLLIDNLFVSGINHHVYHGTCYSPDDAEWPGWLFYASAQFNPQNTIWRDIEVLNEYVTRCQSVLQEGEPDGEVLVYFPVHDVLHDPSRKLAANLGVGREWLTKLDAIGTFRRLWTRGYEFDYASDRQIVGGGIPKGRAIVVPPCRFMPVETLAALVGLSRGGTPVVFLAPGPGDVPGLADLEKRRGEFAALKKEIRPSADLDGTLAAAGVEREPMSDIPGVLFIRRRHRSGHHYFIANQGDDPVDEWARLSVPCQSVLIMDPMSGRTGLARTREGAGGPEIRLRLQPGASCILRTFRDASADTDEWPYREAAGDAFELTGTWRVEFIEGGPALPAPYETDELSSWTDRGDEAERFAGTAIYRLKFDAPSNAAEWLLDLGEVHSSARVRLNGESAGTLIGPSFKTALTGLRPEGNVLEVEVTNLAANRIRDLDRRGVEWKIFEDINMVSREYEPLDAGEWPVVPSGLLGPVRLTPLTE